MEVTRTDPDRKALPEGQPGSHPPGEGRREDVQLGGLLQVGFLSGLLEAQAERSLTLEPRWGRILFNQLIPGHFCLCPLYWLPESGGYALVPFTNSLAL